MHPAPEIKPQTPHAIHPTAIVSPEATVHPGATIGPRCTVSGPATIGPDAHLIGDVQVSGDTAIGAGTVIYPFACIGFGPQHVKIRHGDPIGGVTIGEGCTLREHTTVHAAMDTDARTVIGDRAYMMVGAHIGHDSVLGDDVIVCNSALIGGHCEIHDNAYISGNVAIHQFVRVGRGAMFSGNTGTSLDIPPYAMCAGRNYLNGLNLVGMRRAGIPRQEITVAREAYRRAFKGGLTRDEQLAVLDELAEKSGPVRAMAEFVRGSTRAIATARPHALPGAKDSDGVA